MRLYEGIRKYASAAVFSRPIQLRLGKWWHHPNVERMATSFTRAGEILISHRGALYNATLGPHLTTLSRVAFDDLFRVRNAS